MDNTDLQDDAARSCSAPSTERKLMTLSCLALDSSLGAYIAQYGPLNRAKAVSTMLGLSISPATSIGGMANRTPSAVIAGSPWGPRNRMSAERIAITEPATLPNDLGKAAVRRKKPAASQHRYAPAPWFRVPPTMASATMMSASTRTTRTPMVASR